MRHQEQIRKVPGSDTAVLLIHGIVGTPEHFRDFLPLIPENWTVYNLLLDGHGHGVKEFGQTSMKKWKAQVSARLEELRQDHEHIYIAGHSMGTLLAIREAVHDSSKLRGLFLLAVPVRVFVSPRGFLSAAQVSLGLLGKEGSNARAMARDAGVKIEGPVWHLIPWIPRFLELLGLCREVRLSLPQLTVPTMAFQSRKDEMVAMAACRELKKCPAVQLTVLPDSGHFGYGEKDLQLLEKRFKEMLGI